MANGFRGGNGNIGITRDQRTPAEVSRKETGGWVMDFKIPVAMAAVLGIGSMLLFWAGMWAIRAMGRGGFWFVAAIMSGAHLGYVIWMAAKYDNETLANTVGTGLLVSLLTGWFALAVDRVLFLYALQAAQVAPFVGLLVFLVMIAVRFVQDLALFGSPFVEKAIGDTISAEKAPWPFAGLGQKPTRPLPNEVNLRVVYTDENNKDRSGLHSLTTPFPYPDTQLRQIASIITTDGISESALCGSNGKPFPGGTGGRQALAEFKLVLQERNWGKEKVEGSPTQGFILTKLGENVFHGLTGTTPPHREVTETDAGAALDERTNGRTDVVPAESGQDMEEMHPDEQTDGEPDEWSGELPTPDGEW